MDGTSGCSLPLAQPRQQRQARLVAPGIKGTLQVHPVPLAELPPMLFHIAAERFQLLLGQPQANARQMGRPGRQVVQLALLQHTSSRLSRVKAEKGRAAAFVNKTCSKPTSGCSWPVQTRRMSRHTSGSRWSWRADEAVGRVGPTRKPSCSAMQQEGQALQGSCATQLPTKPLHPPAGSAPQPAAARRHGLAPSWHTLRSQPRGPAAPARQAAAGAPTCCTPK